MEQIDPEKNFSESGVCNLNGNAWIKPPMGWFKANVDEAATLRSLQAGCGGVFRDAMGAWLFGFTKSLGTCSAQMVEEWSVFEALQCAWEMGIRKLILESDAQIVLDLIADPDYNSGSLLMVEIRELRNRD
ncbi:hypothetical protein QN277_013676 [Acacia crassicarpa]|uniref:RNase H type-1 domain-containing protein n=1 Tax=Acacia crassicarpa TaxID=499986 RepID=A0AAE1N3A6_9FABA|nr:hypothetical protein QN277_013676 [Acacia crassicarpa]